MNRKINFSLRSLSRAIFGTGLLALTLTTCPTAQAQRSRTIFLTGGAFGAPGNHVKVNVYDPTLGTVPFVADSFPANSTSSCISYGTNLAYTADTALVLVRSITGLPGSFTKTRVALGNGFTALARYPSKNQLFVTRSYATDTFLSIYDAFNLNKIRNVELPQAASGIVIAGDTAYVTMPGSFSDSIGMMAVIDLKNDVVKRVIDFDTLGNGIGKVYLSQDQSYLIAVCYEANNILKYNIATGAYTLTTITGGTIDYNSGSSMVDDTLFFQVSKNFSPGLYTYDTKANNGIISANPYIDYSALPHAMGETPFGYAARVLIQGGVRRTYVTSTNYSSFGKAFVFNAANQLDTNFYLPASPEYIDGYELPLVSLEKAKNVVEAIEVYPNPSQQYIQLALRKNLTQGRLTISNLAGQVVEQKGNMSLSGATRVDVSGLANGMYILQIATEGGQYQAKFIKN